MILSEFNGNGAGPPGLTVDGNGPRSLVANDFQNNLGGGLTLTFTPAPVVDHVP